MRATQIETPSIPCLALSPGAGYPRLHLKWHMCLTDIVQDRIHPFNHRSF